MQSGAVWTWKESVDTNTGKFVFDLELQKFHFAHVTNKLPIKHDLKDNQKCFIVHKQTSFNDLIKSSIVLFWHENVIPLSAVNVDY